MSGSQAAGAGGQQWLRQLSLIVASGDQGIELSQLHCWFKTMWGTITTPPTCIVRIYNPADQTKSRLLDHNITPVTGAGIASGSGGNFAKLVLRAGYEKNFGVAFSGDMIQVREVWESATDHALELFAGDCDYGHTWAVVNQSLSAGYTVDDYVHILNESYNQYNVDIKPMPDQVPRTAAPRGRTVFGMSRDHIRRLMFTTGLGPFYKEGSLQFLPVSAYLPGQTVEINYRTGMIQVPNETNFGIEVKMLLNPSVGPGVRLRINNKSVQQSQYSPNINESVNNQAAGGANLAKDIDTSHDGDYRVLYVTHEGDTRGTPWYTTATCVAVDPVSTAGAPNIPIQNVLPEG